MKYFEIYRVPNEQRVQLASLFFTDKADSWFHNCNKDGEHTWEEFNRGICYRFGDDGLKNIVEDFMKFK